MRTGGAILLLAFVLGAAIADVRAGEADVVAAEAHKAPDGSWTFEVTVRHADEGWHHYADAWEVRALDGALLARRILLHPHVGEQPFTRSLAGVRLPPGTRRVRIRAHDSVHGYGGRELELLLPQDP